MHDITTNSAIRIIAIMFWILWIPIVFFGLRYAPLFLPYNSGVRYYACFYTLFIQCILGGMHVIIVSILLPGDPRHGELWSIHATSAMRIMDVDIEVKNQQKMDGLKKSIVMANHQSLIDSVAILMMNDLLGIETFVIKSVISWFFPFGTGLKQTNAIFINRADRKSAIEQLDVKSRQFFFGKRNEELFKSLIIFPEGTRGNGKELLPFKKGGFHLAASLNLPIVPIVLSNHDYMRKGKFFKRGKIIIEVLDPVWIKSPDGLDKAIEDVRSSMDETFQRLKHSEKSD